MPTFFSWMTPPSVRLRFAVLMLIFLATPLASGCMGIITQVAYLIYGEKRYAEYDGLEGQRVAVVCVSSSTSYSSSTAARQISHVVGSLLQRHVDEIKVTPQSEVDDWIDNNAWSEVDYREIGRGLKVDKVVAVDLHAFAFRNPTIYRGKADVTVRVLDMKAAGKTTYRKRIPEFTFPVNGGMHTTDATEEEFQIAFVESLGWDIGKRFYDYDTVTEFAKDKTTLSR